MLVTHNASTVDDMTSHSHASLGDDHFTRMLDLDAIVAGPLLDVVTALAAQHAPAPVREIVDLGAGTGTGTLALARRFPDARIRSVDNVPAMLDRIREAATEAGCADRVVPVAADLDQGWPGGRADLVWAALSLHHVAEPARLLTAVRDALAPDGIVVLVEMDAPPLYLPHDLGFGRPGLEQRLHEAVRTDDMDPHPDWTDTLDAIGLSVVARQSFDITRADPADVARLAHLFLTHVRTVADEPLDADDVAALDRLLGDGPDSVLHRTDLSVRGTRTVWVARRA
jgi:SAM-dependent methyltransferase